MVIKLKGLIVDKARTCTECGHIFYGDRSEKEAQKCAARRRKPKFKFKIGFTFWTYAFGRDRQVVIIGQKAGYGRIRHRPEYELKFVDTGEEIPNRLTEEEIQQRIEKTDQRSKKDTNA